MSKGTIRVAHLMTQSVPYLYPCADKENRFDVNRLCRHPGADVELIRVLRELVILKNIGYSVEHVKVHVEINELPSLNTSGMDVFGFALHDELWSAMPGTVPSMSVMFERPAVLTTSGVYSQSRAAFGFAGVFKLETNGSFLVPSVWLCIGVLLLLRKQYALMLNLNGEFRDEVRLFRPSFTATLLPITLGLMLIAGLYRTSLLAQIMTENRRFLVDNLQDLVTLSNEVQIVGDTSVWRNIIQSKDFTDDQRRRLARRRVQRAKFNDVEQEVRDGRAVFVSSNFEATVHQSQCNSGIRRVPLDSLPVIRSSFGLSTSTSTTFRYDVDKAIISLTPMLQKILERYWDFRYDNARCHLPGEAERNETSGQAEDETGMWLRAHSLDTLKGVFLLLAIGLLAAATAICVELLYSRLGRRVKRRRSYDVQSRRHVPDNMLY